jgi:hypothetical protein
LGSIVARLVCGRQGDQNTSRRRLDVWFDENDKAGPRRAMPLSLCRTRKDLRQRSAELGDDARN